MARPTHSSNRPITAADERGADGRDAQEVAGGNACESDVSDAVSDQAHPALHEEEADRGREQADDRAPANAYRMKS